MDVDVAFLEQRGIDAELRGAAFTSVSAACALSRITVAELAGQDQRALAGNPRSPR